MFLFYGALYSPIIGILLYNKRIQTYFHSSPISSSVHTCDCTDNLIGGSGRLELPRSVKIFAVICACSSHLVEHGEVESPSYRFLFRS